MRQIILILLSFTMTDFARAQTPEIACEVENRPEQDSQGLLRFPVTCASINGAQETRPSNSDKPNSSVWGVFGRVAKNVAIDPTTYAPAIIFYHAEMRDWDTSQVLFKYDSRENNPDFTKSGIPGTEAISYEDGKKIIRQLTLINFMNAAAANTISQAVQQTLTEKFPNKRKLFRVLGWVQRGALSAAFTYMIAAPHYRQADRNTEVARRLGLIK
jgi:hypothetical protein